MRRLALLLLAACAAEPDLPDHTPHADAAATHPGLPGNGFVAPPPPLRDPSDRPDVVVYGYWPYWGDPLDTVPWDQLTHVAIFSAGLQADGSLSSTSTWTTHAPTALTLAAPYGVKIHLCVTSFDDANTNAVLSSPARRATAIANLKALVDAYGADGVNVDIEGLDAAQRDNYTAFVTELQAAVDEVFLAVPAVDWSDAFDEAALAAVSDGLFIMGYDYHWSGGSPGPVAPLYGGGGWSSISLSRTVDAYRAAGAPDSRLILGLPLYGKDWPTTSTAVPGSSTGTASSRFYTTAIAEGAAYGRRYDAWTETPYAFPSNTRQLWYDDAESLEVKVAYGVGEGLQGIGFWALTYEDADPDLWTRIDALTHGGGGGTAPGPVDGERILDDAMASTADQRFEASASWTSSTNVAGYQGSGYRVAPTQAISDGASWWFRVDVPTCYAVEAWWTSASDRTTSATYIAYDGAGEVGRSTVDQTAAGGRWNRLGTYAFTAGWNRVLLSRWASSGRYAVADAVRLVPSDGCPGLPACDDGDGDGTCDVDDGCPSDPAKTSPGTCGCGVPDGDGDGDGTCDAFDGCPSDPAKTSPGACGCGVPEGTCSNPTCGDGRAEAPETCDDGGLVSGDGCDATCAVEALEVRAWPVQAGALNTFAARGAVAGHDVWFLVAPRAGTTALPGCPGVNVPLQSPLIVGAVAADDAGRAERRVTIPSATRGQTWRLVAVDLASCRVSAEWLLPL